MSWIVSCAIVSALSFNSLTLDGTNALLASLRNCICLGGSMEIIGGSSGSGSYSPSSAGQNWAELNVRPSFSSASIRSEEHTSELQSLMRNSYAVFCLKKKTRKTTQNQRTPDTR